MPSKQGDWASLQDLANLWPIGELLAAIALAWLKDRPSLGAPIASASRPDQLDAIIRALDLTHDVQQVAQLDEASSLE